jgi:hypothetical protein
MALLNQVLAEEDSSQQIQLLVDAIRARKEGTTECLLHLFISLPEEAWKKANKDGIITPQEWTACLAILRRFQCYVEDSKDDESN